MPPISGTAILGPGNDRLRVVDLDEPPWIPSEVLRQGGRAFSPWLFVISPSLPQPSLDWISRPRNDLFA